MAGFRRATPYLLVAALAALSVGAAIVGVAGSQSPGAVLQRAAASTMNSSSFEFRGVTRYQLFGHGGSASTLQTETTTGRYRSPNKWVIGSIATHLCLGRR
jgi:hypothetical protein